MAERFFEGFDGTSASDWGSSWAISTSLDSATAAFSKTGGIATIAVTTTSDINASGFAFADRGVVTAAGANRTITTLKFRVVFPATSQAAAHVALVFEGTADPFDTLDLELDIIGPGTSVIGFPGPGWRLRGGAESTLFAGTWPSTYHYLEIDRSRSRTDVRLWDVSASRPTSPDMSVGMSGDNFGAPTNVRLFTLTNHVLGSGLAAWSGTFDFDSLEINAIPEGGGSSGGGDSIVDLTKTICYNNLCIEGLDGPSGGFPQHGYALERVNISPVEAVGYADKRALQDGVDAADVFLGARALRIEAGVYGSTRGEAFDRLAAFTAAFHPTNAFIADPDEKGFLGFDFFRPTANISQWPVSTYPDGIPQRIYVRAKNPPTYEFVRQKTGGQDDLGMAIKVAVDLWARDPRVYAQESQSVNIGTSTTALPYRGDYPTYPIVTIPLSAAGSSTATIVISGGSVKLNLSGLSAGTYTVDYATREIRKVSDNSLQMAVLSTTFPNDWRQVASGSTAKITSTTGVTGSVSVGYREAFA